jgi:hypothetical protein
LKKTISKLEESRGKYKKYIEINFYLEKIIKSIKDKMKIIKSNLCINYQTENSGKPITFFPLFGLDVDQDVRNNNMREMNLSFDYKEFKANRKYSLDNTLLNNELLEVIFLSPEIPKRKALDIEPKLSLLNLTPLNEGNISISSNKSMLNKSDHSNNSNPLVITDERVKLVIHKHLSKSLVLLRLKPFDKTVEEEQMESIYKGLTRPIVRRFSFSEESIPEDNYEESKRLNNSCTLDYSLKTYNYKKSKVQRSYSLIQLQRTTDEIIAISLTKK